MKQLVILSGKGGTGKTSVTAAFAHLASQSRYADQIILADADVDAANLELVLQPQLLEEQDFRGGQVAVIDQETCASCGDCQAVCRFDAIDYTDGSEPWSGDELLTEYRIRYSCTWRRPSAPGCCPANGRCKKNVNRRVL